MKLDTFGLFLCVAGGAVPLPLADRLPLVIYVNGGSGATVEEFGREVLAMAESGVNTIILSFYLTDSPTFPLNLSNASLQWSTFPEDDRQRIVETLHSKGTKILLGAGGEAEGGHWQNHNATEYGITFCSKAKYLQLDGADFDLKYVTHQDASVTEWLHQSTKSCKAVFPEAIITSAPLSRYFDPEQGKGPFGNGFWDDMLLMGAADGAIHNHMYTQYYNQGSDYVAKTYEELFLAKSYSISSLMRTYPNVPKDTFYVGKPYEPSDGATEDWLDKWALRDFACRARAELGWQGGIVFWQHHWGHAGQLKEYSVLSDPCIPVTTPSPSTTAAPTGPANVVANCKAEITAAQEQWIHDCRAKCSLYGPGGSLSAFCAQSQSDATSLIRCINQQAPFCFKKGE